MIVSCFEVNNGLKGVAELSFFESPKSYFLNFNCSFFSQLNLAALKFVTISSADEMYFLRPLGS